MRTSFKKAVSETNEVRNCYQEGLKALAEQRTKIEVGNTRELGGSVLIDECVKAIYPKASRWDYIFGYKGEAFFMEVHPAHTGEVKTILNKFDWLLKWLKNEAPKINTIKAKDKPAFYWVQSAGFYILKNSPQERAIIQKGLRPVSKIRLN